MEKMLKSKYSAIKATLTQHIPNLDLVKNIWMNHEQFVESVQQINARCFEAAASSQSSSYICFAIRQNTDKSYMWKAHVKILMMKRSLEAEAYTNCFRLMNFGQYLTLLASLEPLLSAIEQNKDDTHSFSVDDTFENSVIESGECLICFERKPDALLTCNHAFCSVCADKLQQPTQQQNFQCPLCRESVGFNTEWIVPGHSSNTAIHDYILTQFSN